MRYFVGLVCVLALGLMGCSETSGTGGTGGMAGEGGSGGIGGAGGGGGSAGTGGMAGSGGTGGMGGGGTGGMGGIGGSGGTSLCDRVTCADTECKIDGVCDADDGLCDYTLVENGAACSLGECLNGVCAGAITVACSHNLQGGFPNVPPLPPFPFDLQVEPGPIVAGNPFTAELTGVAHLPEFWVLDLVNGLTCGSVRTVQLIDLAATVSVRSGATGADVELGIDVAALSPGPTRLCNFPPDQVCTLDSECIGGTCNPPILLQDLPVIDGTPLSPGGCDVVDPFSCRDPVADCDCSACAALDPPGCVSCDNTEECNKWGFCVTGDLLLPLERRTGNYIADPVSGTPILFGWFDGNPPPTNPDGTIQLPEASFANPVPPIGMRVDAAGLALPFQCLMGVDSGGPYGIGIPDQASPTPDSLLITFFVP